MDKLLYMERAFDLAALGRECVSPNPMVGCVIIHKDMVIGEGFHREYGGPHAEVNAINSVKDKNLLSEATVFVTLEPCSHFGKTPPCAKLLIKHKVKKVIIGNIDPNLLVSGLGIEMLKKAGIEVEVGLLSERGEELNKRFFKSIRQGFPYIVLKWAETADGFISNKDGSPLSISNSVTNITVHRWRAEEDAILVGKNTVLSDNPRLNVRHYIEDKHPVRIVLDTNLEIDSQKNIFDGSQKTIIFNNVKEGEENNINYIKETNLMSILKSLKNRGINSVLVEGGRKVHETFMKERLFDEIRLIKSDVQIGEGTYAPQLPRDIILEQNTRILNDQIFYYKPIPTK